MNFFSKIGVKMNLRVIMKNHAVDLEMRFLATGVRLKFL